MKPIVDQLLLDGQHGAEIVVKIEDNLEDAHGVLDHGPRAGVGGHDPGTFVPDQHGDELRREDAVRGVPAMHGLGDEVHVLPVVERELEYEGEGGEERGFFGGEDIRACCSDIVGGARSIFHFFSRGSFSSG